MRRGLAAGIAFVLLGALVGCTATPGSASLPSQSDKPSSAVGGPPSSTVTGSDSAKAGTPAPVPGSPADPTSPAAIRWGTAPVPTGAVSLQPDVVIVGGGGTAIRNGTEDGLTYYLDPAAPHAADLATGKVMFVTGRVLGRVLDVRRAGADLAVTIGPVDITDVIRDARFDGTAPVSLASPVAYAAGNPIWARDPTPDDSTDPGPGPPGLRRISGRGLMPDAVPSVPPIPPVPGIPAVPAIPPIPPVPGIPAVPVPNLPQLPKLPKLPPLPATPNLPAVPGRVPQIPPTVGGFGKQVGTSGLRLVPSCCEGGIGTHFNYDLDGVRIAGSVSLTMTTPKVGFVLNIKGGTVTDARLRIDGASGLKVDFQAARKDSDAQINEKVAIPVDFSVSFAAFGIPLSAVVNQWVVVKTAFSAKGGAITASGEYAFKAGLGFGYSDGTWDATAPTSLTVKQSLLDSLDGISLGATGIVVAYQARFLVGIGAFGFSAGVYFGFTASLGIVRGSDAGVYVPGTGGTKRVVCKGVQVSLHVNYGIGYSIPEPAADLINLFLKVFRSKPIQRADGVGGTKQVFQKAVVNPDLKVCGGSV